MPRYIVVENTPGYLPESDNYETTNRKDAERYASELRRELIEQGYRCYGSARAGHISCEQNSNDLGRVIEILQED